MDDLRQWIFLNGHFRDVEIVENEFPAYFHFGVTRIENRFSFYKNRNTGGLFMDKVIFPEFENELDWWSMNEFRLGAQDPQTTHLWHNDIPFSDYYFPDDTATYHADRAYNNLLKTFKFLYEKWKTQGNTEHANGCYAEMKKVETRRWEHRYEENRSFETFFRWQLNSFLSYFADYGTNPAKAVIKSGWVILLFSIFYLFFPSDWDITNRSEMLGRWKDLFNKKRERSLLSTLSFLLFTAFIHLLNALTLSLNAFTTLGFGDIPTHGAARYVTIVQGFIGWFLLTIFSVSLINQVLG